MPTRAALLTGRNHHSVGMAAITELASAAPGDTSLVPKTRAPLAQFGRCHAAPVWEVSPFDPFQRRPLGMGFEKRYR